MKKTVYLLLILSLFSCKKETAFNSEKTPILEVAGKFLYKDEIDKIVPSDASVIDSADIAERYIKRWVTDVLMFENAQRNINNLTEINKLVEEYRKSLIIHEYEQALVRLHVSDKIKESEVEEFYNQYKSQLVAKENQIKGILLILPNESPKLDEVRKWVRTINSESLEKIEKYSLQHAVSFDYFNKWTSFSEVNKKIPLQIENSRDFLQSTKHKEISDSTKTYFLTIQDAIIIGQIEPFDLAHDKVFTILLNKKKNDFIIGFEKEVYNDALRYDDINFFNK